MRKVLVLFSLSGLFFSGFAVFAEENPAAVKGIFLKTGYSFPVMGHWGDGQAGFKNAPFLKIMALKDYDENLSYGFQAGYTGSYSNRGTAIKLKIFSLTPCLYSNLGLSEKRYYFYLGTGIYQWKTLAYSGFPSASGTEFGFNAGTGFYRDFFRGFRWGMNLEWNHIMNMSDDSFDLGAVNNLDLSLSLSKKW